MKIKLRTLIIVWVLLLALTLWLFVDSLSASITRPLIPKSELKWSSYHAYHCLLYWNGDKITYSGSRIRQTLKACEGNKKWAKRIVKKLHLMRYPVKKRVRKIYDYIYWEYDYDQRYVWLEQARKSGWANCSAYADLFYALCKASKVPVRYVIGWADNGTTATWHSWNRVRIKKRWYWIDCTWDYWLSRKLWRSHSRIIEEW